MKQTVLFPKTKHVFIYIVLLVNITMYSQENEYVGFGFTGTSIFSPFKTEYHKMYYGIKGSLNVRIPAYDDKGEALVLQTNVGQQYNDMVNILDIGFSLRVYPTKITYLGATYTVRNATLKVDEGTALTPEQAAGLTFDYGTLHLGLSIPFAECFRFEAEGNFNRFFESKVAYYGVAVGLVIYDTGFISDLFNY